MPKLTETTNDQLKRGPGRPRKAEQTGNGNLHLVAPHEPLDGEAWAGVPPIQTYTMAQPAPLPPPLAAQAQAQAQAHLKKPLKVALVGTAPSSRMLAPYNDPSWTIWACSPGNMGQIPRYDAWFELHATLRWPENRHFGEPYIKFLSELKCPVYMQDQRYCPNALTFPMQKMVDKFGNYHFTSSFAWMIALAMEEGATEIALYGIDMASRDEYILQRQAIYYFFHEARKRGIKVFAPYESDIMQPPGLYGYSEGLSYGRKLAARKLELKGRVAEQEQIAQNAQNTVLYLKGALEDLDYMESIWGGVQNNSGLDIERKQEADAVLHRD